MSILTEDLTRLAQQFLRRGETQKARQIYQSALDANPGDRQVREGLAALEILSTRFKALTALLQKSEFAEVIDQSALLFREYPDSVILHNLLATAHAGLQQVEPAIHHFRKAIEIRPDIAAIHANLGKVLSQAGQVDDAIASFLQVLRIKPDHADALYSLGIAFRAKARDADAITCFAKAWQIKPDFFEAGNNLGIALRDVGCYDDAIACFLRISEVSPGRANAHVNLAIIYNRLGRYPEAIASLAEALTINSDLADARALKLFLQATICDWDSLSEDAAAIPTLGISGRAVQPFMMLALEDCPARHRSRSEHFAQEQVHLSEPAQIHRPATRPPRLRIGYFSADFHSHAVMYQLIRVLELHDRSRFQIYAYSFGPDADDAMRKRLKAAVDVFQDVQSLAGKDISAFARSDRIDVAIDLMGYTKNCRFEIFANRAAPVQISYLGYPGTLGSPAMDYLIADRTLIPAGMRHHYCEKIIYLPNSHMATDNTKEMSNQPMSRADLGLPGRGFVFCCFNNSYKISPAEFDVWMRLLHRIDGSVLWLTGANPWAERNLRQAAQRRGVDPERIVFAARIPMPDHLARHRLADLFLDTFNYTGHSTTADALWAGLPLVTKLGQGFPARVSAGLLNAAGFPELVADSTEDYERIAAELAENPDKLAALRSALRERRERAPLFDTESFARHIEAGYDQAYQRYFLGCAPDNIEVAPG